VLKIEKLINLLIPTLCGVLLVVIVLVTFAQIVLRNFFDTGLVWYDDISQFSMSWLALFGAIWATQNKKHLDTGVKLHRKLNKKLNYLIEGILALTIASITALLVYQSLIFCLSEMGNGSLALPWLKMGYVFAALPLTMLFLCYYFLKSFFINLVSIFKKT
jgi:TRAP-type C4-dicarboxylate transport system permease small subunit